MGLNAKSWNHIEFIYSGDVLGLLSKAQNQVWDFFGKLAWKTYAIKQANDTFRYPTHGKSVVPVSPSYQDYFIGSYDPPYYFMFPVFQIIVNLLIMILILILFLLLLILYVQVLKRRSMK